MTGLAPPLADLQHQRSPNQAAQASLSSRLRHLQRSRPINETDPSRLPIPLSLMTASSPDLPGSFPAHSTTPNSSSSFASLPTSSSSHYVSKETFSEHDSPLLHLRITSELRRERNAIPRKRLRRRRVLAGCLSLAVQAWVAFLTGRYLFAFLRQSIIQTRNEYRRPADCSALPLDRASPSEQRTRRPSRLVPTRPTLRRSCCRSFASPCRRSRPSPRSRSSCSCAMFVPRPFPILSRQDPLAGLPLRSHPLLAFLRSTARRRLCRTRRLSSSSSGPALCSPTC